MSSGCADGGGTPRILELHPERATRTDRRPYAVIDIGSNSVRVVVYDLAERATRVLSSGPLTPALRASCSVPGLFKPRRVAGRRYVDGGVSDRPGISAATPGARVLYHHLPANSPWRRFTPSQNQPPARPRLHLLHEPTLPRLSPFHLSRGPAAYALAREMTLRRLAEPIK